MRMKHTRTASREFEAQRLRVNRLRQLSAELRLEGRYSEAERACRKALAIAEKFRGHHDRELVATLNDLGVACKFSGRFSEKARNLPSGDQSMFRALLHPGGRSICSGDTRRIVPPIAGIT